MTWISKTSKISRNNPIIDSKSNTISYDNIRENVIQKKYSWKTKIEGGYLDSDLEDSDNLRIYNNDKHKI